MDVWSFVYRCIQQATTHNPALCLCPWCWSIQHCYPVSPTTVPVSHHGVGTVNTLQVNDEFQSSLSGRCWMDALELALKCSSLLKRTMIREGKEDMSTVATGGEHSINFYSLLRAHNMHGFQWVWKFKPVLIVQLGRLPCKLPQPSTHLPPGSMTVTIWKTRTCTQISQTGRGSRTTRSQTQKAWRRARRATATRQSVRTTRTLTWILTNIFEKLRTWNSPMRNWERWEIRSTVTLTEAFI